MPAAREAKVLDHLGLADAVHFSGCRGLHSSISNALKIRRRSAHFGAIVVAAGAVTGTGGGGRRRSRGGNDNVHVQPDQRVDQGRITVGPSLLPARLDDDSSIFDVTELTEPLPERVEDLYRKRARRGASRRDDTDARDITRRRLDDERQSDQPNSERGQERSAIDLLHADLAARSGR